MKDPNYSVCKMFTHPDKIMDYLNNNVEGPISVELHITNKCNFDCLWCEPKLFGRTQNIEMNKETLLALPDKFLECGVKGVLLSGGGEPLLHPNFSEFVNKCWKNEISIGVFTNGSLISEKNIPSLLKCDFVRISFDAGSEKVYNETHNVSVFNQVVKNIENLVTERNKNNYETTIGSSYVISEHNKRKEEIIKYIHLMDSLGIDYVQLRPVRAKKIVKQYELKNIQKIINNTKVNNLKIVYNPHYNTAYKMPKRTYNFCHMTNFQVVIAPNGNMYPCYGFIHRNDKCIGNIKDDFCKSWKNRQVNINCKTECVECRFHLQNTMLNDLKEITHKNFM